MDYHNADGSPAEMCGNGIRVFGGFLIENGLAELADGDTLAIGTRGGVRDLQRIPSGFQVDLGRWCARRRRAAVGAKKLPVAPPGPRHRRGQPARRGRPGRRSRARCADLTDVPHSSRTRPRARTSNSSSRANRWSATASDASGCACTSAGAARRCPAAPGPRPRRWRCGTGPVRGAPDRWKVEVPGGRVYDLPLLEPALADHERLLVVDRPLVEAAIDRRVDGLERECLAVQIHPAPVDNVSTRPVRLPRAAGLRRPGGLLGAEHPDAVATRRQRRLLDVEHRPDVPPGGGEGRLATRSKATLPRAVVRVVRTVWLLPEPEDHRNRKRLQPDRDGPPVRVELAVRDPIDALPVGGRAQVALTGPARRLDGKLARRSERRHRDDARRAQLGVGNRRRARALRKPAVAAIPKPHPPPELGLDPVRRREAARRVVGAKVGTGRPESEGRPSYR